MCAHEIFVLDFVERTATSKNLWKLKKFVGKIFFPVDFCIFLHLFELWWTLATTVTYYCSCFVTKSWSLFSLRSKLYNDTKHGIHQSRQVCISMYFVTGTHGTKTYVKEVKNTTFLAYRTEVLMSMWFFWIDYNYFKRYTWTITPKLACL